MQKSIIATLYPSVGHLLSGAYRSSPQSFMRTTILLLFHNRQESERKLPGHTTVRIESNPVCSRISLITSLTSAIVTPFSQPFCIINRTRSPAEEM